MKADEAAIEAMARAFVAALVANPPPALVRATERLVIGKLTLALAEMRRRYRGNCYLADRVQWAEDWLHEKLAELAREEPDGASNT